ncbi:MAG TPA: class I SAM-dependent methyltransferase [Pirellulales bacterium]|jgi:acetylserotonin N-methyltransferase
MNPTSDAPNPAAIQELLEAFRRSKVMFAAVSLGVFDALRGGAASSGDLATRLACHPSSCERLLNACVSLGLLARKNNQYENTPTAAAYLTSDSPQRMTGYVGYSNDIMWKLWANLEDAVREGDHRWKQTFGWDGPIFSHFYRTEEAKREFLMGMHGFGVLSSPEVVKAFDLSRFKLLVDLGGATGHLPIAACRQYPHMRGVVFDLADAAPLAREIIAEAGMTDRVEIASGDFFADELPEADLYALGRILHDWSEDKIHKLLARIYDRLPAGGGLLIAEKLLNDDKTGPRWAHMQDLNMLSCTEGRERTLAEYTALLKHAGFAEVAGQVTQSPLDAVLALKA